MVGGVGNDVLVGGPGNDIMTGAIGDDMFVFNALNESGVGTLARRHSPLLGQSAIRRYLIGV